MRVEILQLSLENYDLLLLDEPTNHLDMMAISELIDALNDYEGTLVIISHNRDFIDKTCNKVLYLYHQKGYYYEGPYSEFKERQLSKIMQEEREKLEEEEKQKRLEKEKQARVEKEKTPVVKKTRLTIGGISIPVSNLSTETAICGIFSGVPNSNIRSSAYGMR